jgi:hypothetical protein
MASAKQTTNHDKIREWVEDRGGYPAKVKGTEILRVDYPGFSGEETLERISWDEWLDAFDENNLAFLFQDEGESRFSKLVERRKRATASRKRAATTSRKRATPKKRAASSKRATSSTKKRAASTKKRAASSKTRSATKTRSAANKSASAKRTTDHDLIRRWVESRGGWPATVKATKTRGDNAGLLRIDYPGYSGAGRLERISWNDFFKKFDREKLAFLYQDKPRSRFSKLVRK